MGSTTIDTLLRLPEESWIEIVLALRFHAEFRIRRYVWNSSRHGLPRGWTADDVVLDTIASVLDGTRTIDLHRQELLDGLRSIVNSKVSALVQRMEHRTTVHAQNGVPISALHSGADEDVSCLPDSQTDLESLLSEVRRGMAPELIPVLEEMVDGYRPAEIAIRLGIPVEAVYGLVRRARAHVAKVWRREGE